MLVEKEVAKERKRGKRHWRVEKASAELKKKVDRKKQEKKLASCLAEEEARLFCFLFFCSTSSSKHFFFRKKKKPARASHASPGAPTLHRSFLFCGIVEGGRLPLALPEAREREGEASSPEGKKKKFIEQRLLLLGGDRLISFPSNELQLQAPRHHGHG